LLQGKLHTGNFKNGGTKNLWLPEMGYHNKIVKIVKKTLLIASEYGFG
jgi:hypothetical protein